MSNVNAVSPRKHIGFVGAGNMARAIAGGLVRAGLADGSTLWASDVSQDALEQFVEITAGTACATNMEVGAKADVVILATKPFQAVEVTGSMGAAWSDSKVLISICAGIPCGRLEAALGAESGQKPRVVRVMPNTPALIGCGTAGVAGGRFASEADVALAVRLFESVGDAVAVREDQMDLVTGLSGSGPAYVYRFIEAMIAAGVDQGLSETEARALVPRMVLGASRLAVESGQELSALRAAVTTKGGTTEAGLRVLEEGGLLDLVNETVLAATRRAGELASA